MELKLDVDIDCAALRKRTILPCIYRIVNLVTDDFYIGSAWKPLERRLRHVNQLRNGTHTNIVLARAYHKYGDNNFAFELLEVFDAEHTTRDELFDTEQLYMDVLTPRYNIDKDVHKHITTKQGRDRIAKKFAKRWIVTEPSGKEYEISNLKRFCRENGLHQSNLWYIAQGKAGSSNGWKCKYADGSTPVYTNKNERTYLVTSPDGTTTCIRNLTRFCKENNLTYAGMVNILTGAQQQHRGYRVQKIPENEVKDSFTVPHWH